MEAEQIGRLYQAVAHVLVNMIPEDWSKVLMYAEVREGYRKVFFYYYPQENTSPVYSLDIKKQFQLDHAQFNEMENELYRCFTELWYEFKDQGQEPWTQLTYILDSTGELKINYNYEDVSQISPVDKQDKWEAEYLGIHR